MLIFLFLLFIKKQSCWQGQGRQFPLLIRRQQQWCWQWILITGVPTHWCLSKWSPSPWGRCFKEHASKESIFFQEDTQVFCGRVDNRTVPHDTEGRSLSGNILFPELDLSLPDVECCWGLKGNCLCWFPLCKSSQELCQGVQGSKGILAKTSLSHGSPKVVLWGRLLQETNVQLI